MTDRYEIIKLIKKDPAGAVYLAQDTTLGRKVIFRHIDNVPDTGRSGEWTEQFNSFSGKLCALQHPNLLTIYDVSVDGDGGNIVTQHVESESLTERLDNGPLRQIGVYGMASDTLEALHAAHTSGVYHGALHTASVRRLPKATGGHRYLIVDLGLNTLASMLKGEEIRIDDPVLLAPELHEKNAIPDARADLFMLGQLCYTALAGGHPFAGKSPEQCAAAYLAGELPLLAEYAPEVQQDFSGWIASLTAGDAAERPASAEEAMASLQAITINEPEPNVPGKTQAVAEAPPVASATSATASVATAGAQPAPQAAGFDMVALFSNKKAIVAMACLSVLILVAGIALLVSGGGGDETAEKPLPGLPDGVKVHLHDVEPVNTLAKRKDPVAVPLDSGKILDWTVATGVPVTEKREKKPDGHYIQGVFAHGKFQEYAMPDAPVKFVTGDRELVPRAVTNSDNKHRARPDDGWKVILRIPPKHKGNVIVNLYMVQSGCDLAIGVTMPDGKEEFNFEVPAQTPGVFRLPVEIANPKPGGFYTIKVTAKAGNTDDLFEIGLDAVSVESR